MRKELLWALLLAPFVKVALVDGYRYVRSLLREQQRRRDHA
jgi:hypothetical protein